MSEIQFNRNRPPDLTCTDIGEPLKQKPKLFDMFAQPVLHNDANLKRVDQITGIDRTIPVTNLLEAKQRVRLQEAGFRYLETGCGAIAVGSSCILPSCAELCHAKRSVQGNIH